MKSVRDEIDNLLGKTPLDEIAIVWVDSDDKQSLFFFLTKTGHMISSVQYIDYEIATVIQHFNGYSPSIYEYIDSFPCSYITGIHIKAEAYQHMFPAIVSSFRMGVIHIFTETRYKHYIVKSSWRMP